MNGSATFRFGHEVEAPQQDLLGPLRGFVGAAPADGGVASRTWSGPGFNMLWRPNHGQSGKKPYFLQLMFITETFVFTEIAGAIANRGSVQDDIAIGGVKYSQQSLDTFDGSGQHDEGGHWLNVPATKNPTAPSSVVRIGSVPHGVGFVLQGVPEEQTPPVIPNLSISPFPIGLPGNQLQLPEEDLGWPSTSRTRLERVAGLDQDHLDNPSLFLSDALAGKTILDATMMEVVPPGPDDALVGGGISNIAFLTGTGSPPLGGPNAFTSYVESTFWIERIKAPTEGNDFDQLQYYQRVLLNFMGMSFPHITVATLR